MRAARPAGRRVLHVITGLGVGGAEVMLLRLVERWQAAGHRNLVLSLMRGGELVPGLAATGAQVVELGLAHGRLPGPAALKLGGIVRAFAPDLIQGWMYHGNLAASVARRLARRTMPVVWGIHHSPDGDESMGAMTRAVVGLGGRLSARAARIVYCSGESARQHERRGYDAGRSAVIPNGTDCERFRPDADARGRLRALLGVAGPVPVIGMVARYHPMKDHANLIRALARLRGLGHAAHLLLAGDGVDAANAGLVGLIASLGLGAQVSLLGRRDDVDRLLPGLDAFALASAYGEAFPLALGEAMAAGVPCVATAVGDSAAILGDTGEVVPPRDSKALAAALARLIGAAPDERRRRGDAARLRIVREFALPGVSERYLDLHGEVLAAHALPAPAQGSAPACAG